MNAEEMWAAWGKGGGAPYEAWAFGDDPDGLARLVAAGVKNATSSAFPLYEIEGEDLRTNPPGISLSAECFTTAEGPYQIRFWYRPNQYSEDIIRNFAQSFEAVVKSLATAETVGDLDRLVLQVGAEQRDVELVLHTFQVHEGHVAEVAAVGQPLALGLLLHALGQRARRETATAADRNPQCHRPAPPLHMRFNTNKNQLYEKRRGGRRVNLAKRHGRRGAWRTGSTRRSTSCGCR